MGSGVFCSVILNENVFHLTALTARLEGKDKICSQVILMSLNKNKLYDSFYYSRSDFVSYYFHTMVLFVNDYKYLVSQPHFCLIANVA